MTTKIRTQNLRGFTVQILHQNKPTIVGTGVIIAKDGRIVTCAHVARGAVANPSNFLNEKIPIYFPQLSNNKFKKRMAIVKAYLSEYEDDVVLLQVVDELPPLKSEHIAILGMAENSDGHAFKCYGYRTLGQYPAGYADGLILGSIEPRRESSVQVDPVQLRSSQIDKGMSGAGVLDVERNLVIGIVAETWYPKSNLKDRDTSFAVNASVLALEPFKLPITEEDLEKGNVLQPKTDLKAAQEAAVVKPGIQLHGAPPPLAEWVGREELLRHLDADWNEANKRLVSLIGFGGEGKSSIVRRWLDHIKENKKLKPDGAFWWSFDDQPNEELFYQTALSFITQDNQKYLQTLREPDEMANALAAMLSKGRYVFILDGIEVLQQQSGDRCGLLKSKNMHDFLHMFASPEHQSFCLITSRVPLLDLIDLTTYSHYDVHPLGDDGFELMTKIGVKGDSNRIAEVVKQWDGHALTLSLLAAYLVEHHNGQVTAIENMPAPTVNEPKYERVQRILRHYDQQMSDEGRAFLITFSAFHKPISEVAFNKVFRSKETKTAPNYALSHLDDEAFKAVVEWLTSLHILRFDSEAQEYSAHILIREYYSEFLKNFSPTELRKLHLNIVKYYLARADKMKLMALVGTRTLHGAMKGAQAGGLFGAIGGGLLLTFLFGGAHAISGQDPFFSEAIYHAGLVGEKFLKEWQEND